MEHSEIATNLIAKFEGRRLTAYQDQRGIWTIGFGHTEDVKPGQTCTPEQALEWLNEDIGHVDVAMQSDASCAHINQNQWDALTSFIYNIGSGNFHSSTTRKLLLESDWMGAANAMLMWIHAWAEVSEGLVNRRNAERALFLTPVEA